MSHDVLFVPTSLRVAVCHQDLVRAPVDKLEQILRALIEVDTIAPVITPTTVPARTHVEVSRIVVLLVSEV